MITGFHHVQMAMPPGREDEAREFYAGALGFEEVPKPAHLVRRGGCWFRSGVVDLHLGVHEPFVPAGKAHPAFVVRGLSELRERLEARGSLIQDDTQLEGHERFYVLDPFGNRIELIELNERSSGA